MILALLIMSPLCSSFMPKLSHRWITEEATKTPIDSIFYQSYMAFPNLGYAGNVLNDLPVFFYYTGRNKYAVTHEPLFCRTLLELADTPEERACAIGGCTHQTNDQSAHNLLVPDLIDKTFLVNAVIHVFGEQKVDNYVERLNPTLTSITTLALSDYEKCAPLFKTAMMGDIAYRDMSESELNQVFADFIKEVQTSQTGYDPAFKQKSFLGTIASIPLPIMGVYLLFTIGFTLITSLLFIKIVRRKSKLRHWIGLVIFGVLSFVLIYLLIGALSGSAFQYVVNVIRPISELVPTGDPQSYIDLAIQDTKDLFTYGEVWLDGKEASGFTRLDAADARVLPIDYLILFILSLSLGFFVWFLFKKNKIKGPELIGI